MKKRRQPQLTLQGRGDHKVRLDIQIPWRKDASSALADLQTPQVIKQILEVETDSALTWLVDGVATRHDPLVRLATILLMPGKTTRISLRSAEDADPPEGSSLYHDAWLNVSPGAISIEHQIRAAPESGATSVLFELEEGFKLESIVGDDRRPITPLQLSERRWRTTIGPPQGGEASIRILTSMTQGRVPERLSTTGISFPNAKTIAARIAATASSDFVVESESRLGVTLSSLAEFAKSWPPGRAAPQVAISVEANRPWSIAVRPRVPLHGVRQETKYVVHHGSMTIQFDAEISSAGDPTSIYDLRVPPGFRVDALTLTEGAVNRLVRFARTSPERITVFARTAATGVRQIALRGNLDFDTSTQVALPAFSIQQSSSSSAVLRIFRGFDALVELSGTKGLRSVEPNSNIDREGSRLLAVFEASSEWEGTILASPNQPVVNCESRIRFQSQDSKWQFVQAFSLKIENGVVDALELELPAGMRDPISIEPSEPFRVVRAEGAPAKLVISPTKPWKDACDFKLHGDFLADSATSELIFRPMRPLGVATTSSWIAAPRQSSGGAFNWKGDNAEEVQAPVGEINSASFRWFKQGAPESYVQLQSAAPAIASRPRLDCQVIVEADHYSAIMTWRWSGPLSQELRLTAPAGVRIIDARTIGSMSRISQVDERQWLLHPITGAAPPTIRIICAGPLRLNEPISLPRFEGVASTDVVLTVKHPADIEISASKDAKVTHYAALVAQLKLLEQTKRDAQPMLSTINQAESSSWRRAWIASWDAVRGRLAKFASAEATSDVAPDRWLSEADADRARMGQELAGVASEPKEGELDGDVNDQLFETDLQSGNAHRKITYLVGDKELLTVRVGSKSAILRIAQEFRETLDGFSWVIPAGACGLLALLFFTSSLQRRSIALRAAPFAAWIAVGVTWWLWFSPSWFGPFLAITVVLFSAISNRVQSRRFAT